MLDVGRVCVKLAGREVGRKCVILERVDKNFVLVAAPGVKRRRCNVRHLEPTDLVLEFQGTGEEAVKAALEKAKVSFGD
ncbi:MAG: 50S ribosomal protein L14e [Candidatus Hydrothermarchaeota archaeon]